MILICYCLLGVLGALRCSFSVDLGVQVKILSKGQGKFKVFSKIIIMSIIILNSYYCGNDVLTNKRQTE